MNVFIFFFLNWLQVSAEFLVTELVACEVRKIGHRCFGGTDRRSDLATKTTFYGYPWFGYVYLHRYYVLIRAEYLTAKKYQKLYSVIKAR